MIPEPGEVGFRGDPSSLKVIDSSDDAPAGTRWYGSYLRVLADDVRLEGVHIKGGLHITGGGTVTVRNSIIEGGHGWWGIVYNGNASNFLDISDSTLRWREGSSPSGGSAGSGVIHGARKSRIVRNDISGMGDGIQVAGDAVIEQNHIHDLFHNGVVHNDGIQFYAGTNHQVRFNRFETPYNSMTNGVIFTQGSGIGTMRIEGNYIDGGGYQLHLQNGRIAVVDNTFGPNKQWGTHRVTGATVSEWSGNVHSGGGTVAR